MKFLRLSTIVVLSFGVFAWSGQADSARADIALHPYGGVSLHFGQLVRSCAQQIRPPFWSSQGESPDHVWLQTINATFGMQVKLSRWIRLNAGYRARIWHSLADDEITSGDTRHISSGPDEGNAVFTFGDAQAPPFELTIGLFNFCYAPESQDLGEYLFQSGVYPGFVFSRDMASKKGTDLVGFHLASSIVPNFEQHLFFTSEVNIIPNYDYSLSYFGQVNVRDVLRVGGGFMLYRLLPVDADRTTPERYARLNPVTGDTIVYTHAGTKLMARAAFDPKPLFGWQRPAARDLVVYGEAAVLGTKNYAIHYEEFKERVPLMAGFYLPVFGLLDFLCVEVEWYGSPHRNNPYNDGIPFVHDNYALPEEPGAADDWKWAVSAQKSIEKGFSIAARAANDHLRVDDGTGAYVNDPEERTVSLKDWYWSVLVSYSF